MSERPHTFCGTPVVLAISRNGTGGAPRQKPTRRSRAPTSRAPTMSTFPLREGNGTRTTGANYCYQRRASHESPPMGIDFRRGVACRGGVRLRRYFGRERGHRPYSLLHLRRNLPGFFGAWSYGETSIEPTRPFASYTLVGSDFTSRRVFGQRFRTLSPVQPLFNPCLRSGDDPR
jgi:hypothetical protein